MAATAVLCLLGAACGQTLSEPADGGVPVAAPDGERPAVTDESAAPAEPAPAEPEPEVEEPTPDASEAEQDESDGAEAGEAEPGDTEPVNQVSEEAESAEAPPPREVGENGWTAFATVAGVILHHPSSRVERVGFHEANHAGARQLDVLPDAIAPITLDSRGRDTGSRSAADVVVDPDAEIRAPVSGTVLRAGTYVLYCDYSDDYVVIEPDARPGWEVKLLHIDGVRVDTGDRVEAGVTQLAPRPTPLPFESQVDEHTAEPSWPHVHLEVVDPSIPNPPSGGGC